MAVLESMALGKPVIASRIGGLPEQVNEGETGYLFEMKNIEDLAKKMERLIVDSELRKTIGIRARKKS